MTELDFLPEWYKQGRRRRSQMRQQYLALVLVFCAMMTFNVTSTHRAGRAAARLAQGAEQRLHAESVTYEFNLATQRLNALKGKADLIARIDGKVDVAAVLAEVSHLVGESVVLRKVEFTAEPFEHATQKEKAKNAAVRPATEGTGPGKDTVLGDVRFRLVLAGMAAQPAHVADLICRLDESPYFRHVSPSFSRSAKIQFGTDAAADRTVVKGSGLLEVTEFEITGYLANYEEIGK